ncbi:MAG: methyltransferase domain-containing protein [Bernardetiaceae bacterium]|nr:methyltransferase domain-containing protein [Bernardetiaceae bacterium]
MIQQKEWFATWFDSPYYHILYKHRDYSEAQKFIDNLVHWLELPQASKIIDIACGRGRHSIYLSQKGFDVTGIDLSAQSIAQANMHAHAHLHFYRHDMREVFRKAEFSLALNLFTSFGYFDTQTENQDAITAMAIALKKNGRLVLDFLNTEPTIQQLNKSEIQEIQGIRFEIKRRIEKGFIIKDIMFADQGKNYHFQERVRAITYEEFLTYFEKANLKLEQIFGNYELENYNKNAERMIFVLKKE